MVVELELELGQAPELELEPELEGGALKVSGLVLRKRSLRSLSISAISADSRFLASAAACECASNDTVAWVVVAFCAAGLSVAGRPLLLDPVPVARPRSASSRADRRGGESSRGAFDWLVGAVGRG